MQDNELEFMFGIYIFIVMEIKKGDRLFKRCLVLVIVV